MADRPSPIPPNEEAPASAKAGANDRAESEAGPEAFDDASYPERDRGITDFVRRAVSAGFEVAGRSKDDILRIATSEIRSWLDHLDLDKELVKALSKLTLEVKAEVRFKKNEDGNLVPSVTVKDEQSRVYEKNRKKR